MLLGQLPGVTTTLKSQINTTKLQTKLKNSLEPLNVVLFSAAACSQCPHNSFSTSIPCQSIDVKEEPAVYNLASDPFLPLVYLEKQNDCKYSLFCRKEGVQTCKIDQNTETGKAFLITVRFKLQDIKFNCFKKHQSVVCVFSH